jgi:hypothetical protein
MYLLKVMKSSFTYDSTMNNYVPCVTNYVWYCICTRELLYVWTYIPPTTRSSQKQQHNKEHLEATSRWGAPKSNKTHKEHPKVATQVGMPISNITARSFPPCNNNRKTHKSKEHKHIKQKTKTHNAINIPCCGQNKLPLYINDKP